MDEEYIILCEPNLSDILRCTELLAKSIQEEPTTAHSFEYYTPAVATLFSLRGKLTTLITERKSCREEAEVLRGLKSVIDNVYFSHWKEGITINRTDLLGDMLDAIELLLEREYANAT